MNLRYVLILKSQETKCVSTIEVDGEIADLEWRCHDVDDNSSDYDEHCLDDDKNYASYNSCCLIFTVINCITTLTLIGRNGIILRKIEPSKSLKILTVLKSNENNITKKTKVKKIIARYTVCH